MTRAVVGVFPRAARSEWQRLFDALEEALPLELVGREAGDWVGLSGAVFPGGGSPENIRQAALGHIPAYVCEGGTRNEPGAPGEVPGVGGPVTFGSHETLDARLRGRVLSDETARQTAKIALTDAGELVFAATNDKPLWARLRTGAAWIDRVAASPPRLERGSTLRDHLQAGRFLRLLPLVHFLRSVAGGAAWEPPPARACLLLDDPNLHRPSYGYLRFAEAARHAEKHGYHLAVATVPLDGWLVHAPTVRLFARMSDRLSLLIHGNNHVRCELETPRSSDESRRMLAQALRRVVKLEQRTGLRISRIMAAPHGRCAELTMREMLLVGFEAACVSRPYPWLPRPPEDRPLADFLTAELVTGGFPVLPRVSLSRPREDLVLRAFLDHPLILYGHHNDLADGLDILEQAARDVNAIRPTRWVSIGDIAGGSFYRRREGSRLRILAMGRRLRVEVPEGINEIVVDRPWAHGEDEEEAVVCGASSAVLLPAVRGGWSSDPLPVEGPGWVEIRIVHPRAVDPYAVPAPHVSAWPLVRRLLTEGRDRAQSFLPGR